VGEYAGAIEDLDTAIRLNPRDPEAFNGRAFVHVRQDRLEDAMSDYARAIALNPKNAEALFGRGVVRLRMSDQGGHADIAAAQAINPKIAGVMALLGIVA
jgi:tetratricopeptide (TPR) repeat protein